MSQRSSAVEPGSVPDRRERILLAAEKVFAEDGYHGTTMRTIAREADLKLSLIVYHFETKLGLYREIFERRQYVNDQRRSLLAAVELGAPDALDQIVSAFVDPVLSLHQSPDDLWFARLVLREAADPSSQSRGIIHDLFDPMAREFIAALTQVTPGHDGAFYRWAYLFAVGALTQSSFDDRIRDLSAGPDSGTAARAADTSPNRKAQELRSFIRAGWAQPATPR